MKNRFSFLSSISNRHEVTYVLHSAKMNMTNLAVHLSHLLYMFPSPIRCHQPQKSCVDLSEEQSINDKTLAKTEAEK